MNDKRTIKKHPLTDDNKISLIQQAEIDKINQMTHEEMCKLWRKAPSGHPYFDSTLPYFEIFRKRLYEHFDGFTSKISKSIGW